MIMNKELIRLFVPPELVYSHWDRHIKSTKYNYSQQINFVGTLEENDDATKFFLLKSNKKLFETFLQIH